MIYERNKGSDARFPQFVDQIKLSPQAKNETAAGIKQAFSDTRSALLKLANDTELPQGVRDQLTRRLAFLDARNKFTDLLSFAEFETIPTTANTWFGLKTIARKVQRKIQSATEEQEQGEKWKQEARDPKKTDDQLEALDEIISGYLNQNPDADQRVTKALFAVRSARFVSSLKAHTRDLANLQKPNGEKAWGKLDEAVTQGIQKIARNWGKQLRDVSDTQGAKEVEAATADFLTQLNTVAR